MKLSENKKIVILGLILLVIAGIIVVALKGFNVNLMLSQHESVDFVIGKEFNISDIESICKDVFGDKKVILRKVELFDDAININVLSITDDEKQNFIDKMNEKYETQYTVEDLTISTVPNVRIRDLIKIYIKPVCISAAIIVVYIFIRFKKINPLKIVFKTIFIIISTEAALASLIAITRIPLSAIIINLMLLIALLELLLSLYKAEKKYLKLKNSDEKK